MCLFCQFLFHMDMHLLWLYVDRSINEYTIFTMYTMYTMYTIVRILIYVHRYIVGPKKMNQPFCSITCWHFRSKMITICLICTTPINNIDPGKSAWLQESTLPTPRQDRVVRWTVFKTLVGWWSYRIILPKVFWIKTIQ